MDGYRDQIVRMLRSVMWVCLCIPAHIHCSCMQHSNGSVMHTSIRACFLCFFYNPYMSLFNFSFTCVTMINDAKIECTTV